MSDLMLNEAPVLTAVRTSSEEELKGLSIVPATEGDSASRILVLDHHTENRISGLDSPTMMGKKSDSKTVGPSRPLRTFHSNPPNCSPLPPAHARMAL